MITTPAVRPTAPPAPASVAARLRVLFALSMALTVTTRANAAAIAGTVDPATGITQLAAYVLTLLGGVFVMIGMWKGAHAYAEGRSLGAPIGGAITGMAISYGGYYLLTNYGVTG